MNRRDFLKLWAAGTAVTMAPGILLAEQPALPILLTAEEAAKLADGLCYIAFQNVRLSDYQRLPELVFEVAGMKGDRL